MRDALLFVLKIDGAYVRISGNAQPEGFPTYFHSENIARILLTRIQTPVEKTSVESTTTSKLTRLSGDRVKIDQYDLRENNHLFKLTDA